MRNAIGLTAIIAAVVTHGGKALAQQTAVIRGDRPQTREGPWFGIGLGWDR